jgi:hypothetical protein
VQRLGTTPKTHARPPARLPARPHDQGAVQCMGRPGVQQWIGEVGCAAHGHNSTRTPDQTSQTAAATEAAGPMTSCWQASATFRGLGVPAGAMAAVTAEAASAAAAKLAGSGASCCRGTCPWS